MHYSTLAERNPMRSKDIRVSSRGRQQRKKATRWCQAVYPCWHEAILLCWNKRSVSYLNLANSAFKMVFVCVLGWPEAGHQTPRRLRRTEKEQPCCPICGCNEWIKVQNLPPKVFRANMSGPRERAPPEQHKLARNY
jgi:hypothetical protein